MNHNPQIIQPGLFEPAPAPPGQCPSREEAVITNDVSGLPLFALPPPPLTIESVLPELLERQLFDVVRDAGKRWDLRKAVGLTDEQLREALACEMRRSMYFAQWYTAQFHGPDLVLTITPRIGESAPLVLEGPGYIAAARQVLRVPYPVRRGRIRCRDDDPLMPGAVRAYITRTQSEGREPDFDLIERAFGISTARARAIADDIHLRHNRGVPG